MKLSLNTILLCLLCGTLIRGYASGVPAGGNANELVKRLPAPAFIENKGQMVDTRGQAVPDVYFKLDLGQRQIYITQTGLTYVLDKKIRAKHPGPDSVSMCRIDAILTGAQILPQNIEASDNQDQTTFNYFNPASRNGIYGVNAYHIIRIKNIYPGISWVIHSENGKIKYDFELDSRANADFIKIEYRGAKQLHLMPDGSLQVIGDLGSFIENKPVSRQANGKVVTTNYELTHNIVRYKLGDYNPEMPLIIDPGLAWGTLLGGNYNDAYNAITTDKNGNLFATGYSYSTNFPAKFGGGSYYSSISATYTRNVIISRFNSKGALTWSTYFGGSNEDIGNAIKTDTNGNVFVTGCTRSHDFPIKLDSAFIDTSINSGSSYGYCYDAFLLKFTNNGRLVFSTYLGGQYHDMGFGLDIDNNNNVIVVGRTSGSTFPIKKYGTGYNLSTYHGGVNGFISKFSNRGALLWSTFFGGTDTTQCLSVSADHLGNIFVAGLTNSSTQFTFKKGSGYIDTILNGGTKKNYDGFIAKFDQNANLLWSTLYGGSKDDICVGTSVDNNNNLAVTGETYSNNFPFLRIVGGYNDSTINLKKNKDSLDVFLLKFNNNGVRQWATLFGGSHNDLMLNHDTAYRFSYPDNYSNILDNLLDFFSGTCVADNCGNIYIGFTTNSADAPTLDAGCNSFLDNSIATTRDCFVAKFSSGGIYEWGTYMGGESNGEYGPSLALNSSSDLFVTWTGADALGFPYDAVAGAYYDDKAYGANDIFLGRFNAIKPNASVNYSKCGTGCTGMATAITYSKCPSTYLYRWSNGSKTQTIDSLCTGAYTVIVRDTVQCTADTAQATLSSNSFRVTPTLSPYSCLSTCDGKASVNLPGISTAKYEWHYDSKVVKGTNSITSVCPGNDTLIVTIPGCGADTVYFNELKPPFLTAYIKSITAPSCNGVCDARAVIVLNNGEKRGYATWSTGKKGDSDSGLCAGKTYTVSISDSVCYNTSINITIPKYQDTAVVTVTPCGCSSTATVVKFLHGGKPPYKYKWSNGDTTQTATKLCAGTYSVIVQSKCATDTEKFIVPTVTPVAYLNKTNACKCNAIAYVYEYYFGTPVHYKWSNGDTVWYISGLCTGNYWVKVWGPCGSDSIPFHINPSSKINIYGMYYNSGICNGKCNATAWPGDTGGASPFHYKWSNGDTFQYASNLCLNKTYYLTMWDNCGDTARDSVKVLPNTSPPTGSFSVLTYTCPGACKGVAQVSGSGGTYPYHYRWPDGDTLDVDTGLCAGKTYKVFITDACGLSDTVRFTFPSAGAFTAHVGNSPTCAKACNGVAYAYVSGGVPPYTYRWNTGDTASEIDTACPNKIYRFTAKDQCGSIGTDSTKIPVAAPLIARVNIVDTACLSSCTGIAYITHTGGHTYVPLYHWSNNTYGDTATNLCADSSYTVIVSDPGCRDDTVHFTLPHSVPIKASIIKVNPTCYDSCNGCAYVKASGGKSPYTYKWSNGESTDTIKGLCGQSYNIIISDIGCKRDTVFFALTAPTKISAIVTPYSTDCYNKCDGRAHVTATGGLKPYHYLWSTTETTDTAHALCPGTHYVIVYNKGCDGDTVNYTIAARPKLKAIVKATDPTCTEYCNGIAILIDSGGTPPFTNKWSTGSFKDTITHLCVGTYYVLAVQPGCSADSVSFTLKGQSPPVIHLNDLQNTKCYGSCDGSLSINASGGVPPYVYTWSDYRDSTSIHALCAGTYIINVKDSVGCLAADTFLVGHPPRITGIYVSSVPSHCENTDGTITIAVKGGTPPYTYLWDNGNRSTKDTNIAAGAHYVIVSDSNHCIDTLSYTLTGLWPKVYAAPDTLIYYGTTAQLKARGALKYVWAPAVYLSCDSCDAPVYAGLNDVHLCVTGTDIFGCTDTACVDILINRDCGIPFLPDAFTPNSDDNNDIFRVLGNCLDKIHLTVYNRWGERVYESFAQKDGWNGMYKNKPANQATYMWTLEATNLFGQSFKMKGDVTLIR